MEEVKERIKKAFRKHNLKDRNEKLACVIGYLEDCEEVDRRQAIGIIKDILFEEI